MEDIFRITYPEKAEGDLIGTQALGEACLLDTRANNQRLNDKKGLR